MTDRPRRLLAALFALTLLAGACTATSSTPPSQATASPAQLTPSASAASQAPAPTTPEEAAALVIAQNQDFLGFEAKNPDMIGQCCWWEVTQTSDGYRVLVHAGWGDCPSGCINNHEWVYTVSSAGAVELAEESGDPVPAGGIPEFGS